MSRRAARDGIRQIPSGRWQVRYRDQAGVPRTATTDDDGVPFPNKTAAKAWRTRQMAAVHEGRHVPRDRTTVAEYARRWVDARDVRASTRARYLAIVRTHIEPTPLGRMRLAQVQPTDVREWLADRATVLAPSTLRYVRTFLAAVFAAARDDRLITWSPVEGVKTKAATRSRKPFRDDVLSDEQIEALRAAMPDRYAALVTLLADAGLRIGEALALTTDDIDRDGQRIRVRRTMAPNGKSAGLVKVEVHSDRWVPVPRDLLATLAEHSLAYPPIDDPLGRLIFSTPTGLPVRYHRLRMQFVEAAKAAGVPGATFHALRHRAGSVLLHRGVPAATVARALGHTERVLLDTYSHPLAEGEDLLRAAMSSRSGTGVARSGLRAVQ